MISFGVETVGEFQNISRAIFDAVAAPFATVFYYVDYSLGDDDLLGIQRDAPELHLFVSPGFNEPRMQPISDIRQFRGKSR
jgi:hypothetical protein